MRDRRGETVTRPSRRPGAGSAADDALPAVSRAVVILRGRRGRCYSRRGRQDGAARRRAATGLRGRRSHISRCGASSPSRPERLSAAGPTPVCGRSWSILPRASRPRFARSPASLHRNSPAPQPVFYSTVGRLPISSNGATGIPREQMVFVRRVVPDVPIVPFRAIVRPVMAAGFAERLRLEYRCQGPVARRTGCASCRVRSLTRHCLPRCLYVFCELPASAGEVTRPYLPRRRGRLTQEVAGKFGLIR